MAFLEILRGLHTRGVIKDVHLKAPTTKVETRQILVFLMKGLSLVRDKDCLQ